ncbi:MAG: hypothetical protein ACEQSC_01480 [Candidatus Nanopelagicaceae bacterium]
MKIHKVLTDAIELACKEILENNSHASFVIAQTISKDKRFGSRDRRFMAETISFVLKNYRLLSFLTKQNWEEPKQFSPIVACAIWLENNELPKFYSSTILTDEIAELQSKKKSVSVDFSFPDWMNDLLEKDLGSKKWELEAKHSLDKAFTFLRVNTQKSTLEKCVAFFETAGISHEIVKEVNNCLVLLQRVDITKSEDAL